MGSAAITGVDFDWAALRQFVGVSRELMARAVRRVAIWAATSSLFFTLVPALILPALFALLLVPFVVPLWLMSTRGLLVFPSVRSTQRPYRRRVGTRLTGELGAPA